MDGKLLSGWKEISSHLQRTVRTVQRWEVQLGMPVHRPAAKARSAVVAFTNELDRWLATNLHNHLFVLQQEGTTDASWTACENLLRLRKEVQELASRVRQLQQGLAAPETRS